MQTKNGQWYWNAMTKWIKGSLCSPRSNTTKRIYEPPSPFFPIMENKRFWKAKDGSCQVKNRKREIKFHGRQWQPWNYLWVSEKRGGWFELDMLVKRKSHFYCWKRKFYFLRAFLIPSKTSVRPSRFSVGPFVLKKIISRRWGKKETSIKILTSGEEEWKGLEMEENNLRLGSSP